jgi:aryl-alcohol dehydrogenase-like predicted oxidoreductase
MHGGAVDAGVVDGPGGGDDIVPIPGTKRSSNMEENVGALQVKVTEEEQRGDQEGDCRCRG